jgi:hypothetical protein
VVDGSGDTVHVYEILTVAFCNAGADMDKSSSSETLKAMVSNSAGLVMLEMYDSMSMKLSYRIEANAM